MKAIQGEIYHVCQRGVDGRIIFPDQSFYKRFILSLAAFNTSDSVELRWRSEVRLPRDDEKLIDILAYILRKNHLHILVKCRTPEGFTNFFRKIFVGHTLNFNLQNKRKGVLFQGRPVVKHINSDRYLNHVINYIHLNALDFYFPEWRAHGIKDQKKAQKLLLDYKWSSLPGILGLRDDPIINTELVEEFVDTKDLINSMLDWSCDDYESGQEFFID